MRLYYKTDFMSMTTFINLLRDSFLDPEFALFVSHDWEPDDWKNTFSVKELEKVLREVIFIYNNIGIEYSGMDAANGGFDMELSNTNSNDTIKAVLERKKPYLDEIYEKVSILLIEQSKRNAVVSIFNFPEQIRVPCEQYLIYFADFLKNLGIDATTDINHEAGKVLFSVIPESEEIALQQIREALDVYLNLPSNIPNMQFVSMDIGIKEQQLLAQVQHFMSQIMLANALTQAQRETIENQQIIINQQQKVIDASILQQSLLTKTLKNEAEDNEKILGGTISLTKYEGKGFNINTPNIYRLLREKFRRD